MTGFFQICIVLGGAVLALQVLLSLFGLGVGGMLDVDTADIGDADHEAGTADALNLLSVRALAAGVAVFGAAGVGLDALVPSWMAMGLALVPGLAATAGTAWLTSQMLRLQTSGTLRLADAVGREATVYLTVPPSSETDQHGLIHVVLQGRTVELRAVTHEAKALPSGSAVVILSVSADGETAEVVPASTFEDMIHEDAR